MAERIPRFPSSTNAYRVPWRIVRDERAHPVVVNVSAEAVDFVRAFRDDPLTGFSTEGSAARIGDT